MAHLGSDATTPLHKLDIVQVVLYTAKVAEAKADKGSMSSPVEVLLLLDHLQYDPGTVTHIGSTWECNM